MRRYLSLYSNQISGSVPSVVSGLSSLSYVQSVLCVLACAWVVCDVHVCAQCASATVCACTACVVFCECVHWCGSCVAVASVL